MNKKSDGLRFKFWLFVYYPDSDPDGEKMARFQLKCVPCVFSPWHDRDVFDNGPKKGQLKKTHRHCMVYFKNGVREGTVLSCLDGLAANNIVIPSYSPLNSYQYFFHKYDPDKAQYREEDCEFFNGFTVDLLLDSKEVKASENETAFNEILSGCFSGKFSNFFEISKYVYENYPVSVSCFIAGKTHYLKSILSDYSISKKQEMCIDRLKEFNVKSVNKAFSDGFLEGRSEAVEFYEDYIQQLKNDCYAEGFADCRSMLKNSNLGEWDLV